MYDSTYMRQLKEWILQRQKVGWGSSGLGDRRKCGYRVTFLQDEKFWRLVAQHCEIFHTTEMYTLKQLHCKFYLYLPQLKQFQERDSLAQLGSGTYPEAHQLHQGWNFERIGRSVELKWMQWRWSDSQKQVCGLGEGEGSWTDKQWVSTVELLPSSRHDGCFLTAGIIFCEVQAPPVQQLPLPSLSDICHSHSLHIYNCTVFNKVTKLVSPCQNL